MKKQRSIWLIVVLFLICLPLATSASVTKGQITFYEENSVERPIGEGQSEEPPDYTDTTDSVDSTDSSEETSESSTSKTEETTTLSSQQIAGGGTSNSSSRQEQIDEGHKNQQTLLQTNETLSYVASVFGSLILIFALYKIRRNIS